MRPELHLACDVSDGRIWMGRGIVKDLEDAALDVNEGCGGVRGGYGAAASKHHIIYVAIVVKKHAGDLFHPCLLRGCEFAY